MTDALLKQHQKWMADFEAHRKSELEEALKVETVLNEQIAKFENQLIALRQKNALAITEERKDHFEVVKKMEIEKIQAVQQIEEYSVGVEMMVGEMKITSEMSKNSKTNALSKDTNLTNYSRHFGELQTLSKSILDTLKKELNSRKIFESLRDQIGEQRVLLTRLTQFDNADRFHQQRKVVCAAAVKQLDEIVPHFEIILEYIDGIEESKEVRQVVEEFVQQVSVGIKQLIEMILELPNVEIIKYLENTIHEEMKRIESDDVRKLMKGIQAELTN